MAAEMAKKVASFALKRKRAPAASAYGFAPDEEEVDAEEAQRAHLLARAPALLGRDDLHTKVAILQALGVTRIAWWLQTNPGVLEVDIDAQIKPAVDALREVPRLDVARVLSRQPQVLARGYGDGVKLRERLATMQQPAMPPTVGTGSSKSRITWTITTKCFTTGQSRSTAGIGRMGAWGPPRGVL